MVFTIIKELKEILKPLANIYVVDVVCVGAIEIDDFDKTYNTFEEFIKDEAINNLELLGSQPIDFNVRGYRFIDEICIWVKGVKS